jgi:hypothetical protein
MPATRKTDLLAEVYTRLEGRELTAALLPRTLRRTASGEEFHPTQLQPGVGNGRLELPVGLLTRSEPVRGWESVLATNSEAAQTAFAELIGEFLSQAPDGAQLGPRLAGLPTALEREAGILRDLGEKQRTEYRRTCEALNQQQQAQNGQRHGGWLPRLAGMAFDLTKAVQLWNTREVQAYKIESGEAALTALATAGGQVQKVQANLARIREFMTAAQHTLTQELAMRRQGLIDLQRWLPDWTVDHRQLAGFLAGQAPPSSSALRLLLDPPETLEACLAELQAGARRDTERIMGGLDLAAALETQRRIEQIAPEVDVLLLVGQTVLNTGCLGRSYAWADRPVGRQTLLQLTEDGQPLFGMESDQGHLRSAAAGRPGQVGFLSIVEDIVPTDLAVVCEAQAALAAAQARQNNALLEELLPAPATPVPATFPPEPAGAGSNGHLPAPNGWAAQVE